MTYVSLTKFRVTSPWWRRPWDWVKFQWFAWRSFAQAELDDENIEVDLWSHRGDYYTRSLWKSKRAMSKFMYAGAHRQAIAHLSEFGIGITYGYEAAQLPEWSEVVKLIAEYGKQYRSTSKS